MSSFGTPRFRTFKAEGDLSALQYKFVKVGTADDQVVLCGDNEPAIGVLMNKPLAGEPAEVAMVGGGASLELAGTSTRGDFLESNAAGEGETSSGSGNHAVRAICLESGVDGDIVDVDIAAMSHTIP